eukprot:1142269-Pyramimonas_sp.AAC.1
MMGGVRDAYSRTSIATLFLGLLVGCTAIDSDGLSVDIDWGADKSNIPPFWLAGKYAQGKLDTIAK